MILIVQMISRKQLLLGDYSKYRSGLRARCYFYPQVCGTPRGYPCCIARARVGQVSEATLQHRWAIVKRNKS